ncbi:NAD(P)H-dependent flavin oxidoreductase [Mycobacterium intracellulare]|uniref:NAD(P)H-dependent flavin oxidoreductase n=3 Tax=Mycobacterium intracellulare TaxID=1767 RepID=UPI0004B08D67|nr:nitronate monooxygenase family protein [Mycobacterium intracellulare]APD84210.1 monooxygenase [Mycobacterium intracellulare subsp. chimaera]ARV82911.1 monooxygenase [Mycobacterium intracellulare subsp. chimaera]KPN50664.1 monooxygenase [Mycobacterium intracellulare subsp. chimaera]KPN56259.1 monooxygenase [Mycobacterium intracellulare subsp. chimaera]KPN56365.1 monooxygenase [Mycobacterium intracellulare subsp. chimaera]
MRTRVAEMLGVEFPICAFSHCRDVVAAVTNAGGFGILGATAHSPARLRSELTWIEQQTGGKPYGVDLLLPPKYVGAEQGGIDTNQARTLLPEEHRAFVDDLLARYGVTAPAGDARPSVGGLNISPKSYQPLLDVAFDHDIRLIASALGPPPADLVERAHDAGVLVAALAGTTRHAQRHAAAGVDLIVAQGTEAGGHTGEVATMVLVPEVVDAVAPVPVLAAGGIARGRQIAAALALGAEGVWCGSVWLTTEEAETVPVVKEKFLAATSSDTVRSRSMTGKPARMLRTAWTEEWDRPENPDPLGMPLQTALITEPQLRINSAAAHDGARARELATYFVGQVVGSLDRVRPTRSVVLDMVEEFIDTIGRLDGLVER